MFLIFTSLCLPVLAIDLSHNKLGNRSGRALGKLLSTPTCLLESLVLINNEIGVEGGKAIGHALKVNVNLRRLNLRMNRYVATLCGPSMLLLAVYY